LILEVTAMSTAIPDEILVGGRWRTGRGKTISPVDPATGEVITTLRAAGEEDVEEAVRAGREAGAAWGALLPHERARILTRIGDMIEAWAGEIAALQTANTGKTLAETTALARSAAGTFRYFASVAETLEERITPSRGAYLTISVYEPIGVVGAITPWNSPIASDAQKVAPALAAGNAVVLKPAEWTPLVALLLGRIAEDAGLPPGLLSVLPGPGRVVGEAIVRHPGIGKVSFTGGTATGRRLAETAARKLMPVSLELGGKSPTIVLPDADIEQALAGVMFGAFSSSGQSCIAGSRLFLHRSRYDEILGELVERTRRLRVGPGTGPGVQVGPLVHARHRDSVESYVELARSEGARVLCGGERPAGPDYDAGAYYLPTILDGLGNDSRTCQEEIFGPVLVALPYDDEDDLVAQANDSAFGLACGIWTRDHRAAHRLARRIEAGTVWINTYKQFSISTPFGGMKESGLGREKGIDGLTAYTRQKSLYWGTDDAPLPWAAG
jgi:betaine-aldehyde dehydrogenase